MKKIFIGVVLTVLLSAGVAFAGGNNNQNNSDNIYNTYSTEITTNRANANASARQSQSTNVENRNTNLNAVTQGNSQTSNNEMVNIAPRDFHNAPGISFPEQLVNVAPPTGSANVFSIDDLFAFKKSFTRQELERIVYGNTSLEVNAESFVFKDYSKTVILNNVKVDPEQRITLLLTRPTGESDVVGVLTGSGNAKDTNIEVLARVALDAMNLGATHLYISKVGSDRNLSGTGWGIGLNSSKAKMVEGGDGSEIVTGGLGISGGSSGYKNSPWIQGYALKLQ